MDWWIVNPVSCLLSRHQKAREYNNHCCPSKTQTHITTTTAHQLSIILPSVLSCSPVDYYAAADCVSVWVSSIIKCLCLFAPFSMSWWSTRINSIQKTTTTTTKWNYIIIIHTIATITTATTTGRTRLLIFVSFSSSFSSSLPLPSKMADLEAVLADVSYLMAMEKSKSTPAARASKKIILPDPRQVSSFPSPSPIFCSLVSRLDERENERLENWPHHPCPYPFPVKHFLHPFSWFESWSRYPLDAE